MARTTTELQPIDRLEEKVRQLVTMIDTLRADCARAADEVNRLEGELETARARLADATTASAEIGTLREERDLIRDRVAQMITQIDKLNL